MILKGKPAKELSPMLKHLPMFPLPNLIVGLRSFDFIVIAMNEIGNAQARCIGQWDRE